MHSWQAQLGPSTILKQTRILAVTTTSQDSFAPPSSEQTASTPQATGAWNHTKNPKVTQTHQERFQFSPIM